MSLAYLDLTLLGPDGQPSGLSLNPVVTGFHVPDRSRQRHRFVPSLAFPGRDECGFAVGWMMACGRPKADELHHRRSHREVEGAKIIQEAARGRAQVVELRIPGLNA